MWWGDPPPSTSGKWRLYGSKSLYFNLCKVKTFWWPLLLGAVSPQQTPHYPNYTIWITSNYYCLSPTCSSLRPHSPLKVEIAKPKPWRDSKSLRLSGRVADRKSRLICVQTKSYCYSGHITDSVNISRLIACLLGWSIDWFIYSVMVDMFLWESHAL